jgi:hypothetical protein
LPAQLRVPRNDAALHFRKFFTKNAMLRGQAMSALFLS